MSLDQFLSDPSKLGMIGMMAVALVAILRGWVITAGHHAAIVTATAAYHASVIAELKATNAELAREKEEFKQMVLRTVDTADRALQAAERVASDNIHIARKR